MGMSDVLPIIILTLGFIFVKILFYRPNLNNSGKDNLFSQRKRLTSQPGKYSDYKMKTITLLDKQFKIMVPASQIKTIISRMASRINEDFKDRDLVFVSILNGSFIFAADLVRKVRLSSGEIHFVKMESYYADRSSGKVKTLFGLDEQYIKDKDIIIIEDIVDSGLTMENVVSMLKKYGPKSVSVAALFFKPQSYLKNSLKINYVGFEIPEQFIVGYGLDYKGKGRFLEDVYVEC